MTDALSCADLMAEAQNEYEALPLETRAGQTVQLRNLLMLPPEGLKAAQVILSAFEDGADLEKMGPQLRDLLLTVADDTKAMATEMRDWPLGMFMRVVTAWQEATQAPEVLDSAS
ncbi:phage tail assembly protein [Streptomyces radicis]|uniref:Tail assembly chaperone n=1 Tax=Streptomyces radicis TaxID=1750517 RepID=A0A3A9WAH7_9ACTN|nr:phage tail assembly protein [Streptomyces radicis]RKN09642.1 hypothetical protein D7319_11295 [Streptomyces radicis]